MANFFDNMKTIKNNPFAKKKAVVNTDTQKEEAIAAAPDPVTEETTAEKLARIKKNGTAQDRVNVIMDSIANAMDKNKVDKKESKVEEIIDKVENEPVTEATVDETPIKEVPVEEATPVEDIPTEEAVDEEPPAEEKPKKKATRKTKAKETVVGSGTDATSNKFVLNYDVLGEKMSYDEITSSVRDYYLDSDWQSIEDEINTRLSEMIIAPDMNSATLLELLANIDMLNTDIQMQIRRDKQFMDSIANKEFGVATAIKFQNYVGTNEHERRRNGYESLTQVPVGSKKINYIYAIAVATMRLSFLENVSRQLDYKRQMCITVAGNLKIENSLSAAHV